MRVRPLLWASLTLTLAPILSEDNESCGPHPRAGLLDTSPPLTYKGLLGALWRMSFHTWRDSRPERTMGTNPTAVCWSHTHHGGGCRVSQDSPGVGALLFDLGETGAGVLPAQAQSLGPTVSCPPPVAGNSTGTWLAAPAPWWSPLGIAHFSSPNAFLLLTPWPHPSGPREARQRQNVPALNGKAGREPAVCLHSAATQRPRVISWARVLWPELLQRGQQGPVMALGFQRWC